MDQNREYLLAMPQSVLLEELVSRHKDFVVCMSPFFGLPMNSVAPIPTRFYSHNEKPRCSGIFNPTKPEIIIEPYGEADFKEFVITIAHESAHYLHWVKCPQFYPDPGSRMNEADGSTFFSLAHPFRELVADMAVFEFLRLHGRLNHLLSRYKQTVLDKWDEMSHTRSNAGVFRTLRRYRVYQQLSQSGQLTQVIGTKREDTGSLKKVIEQAYETIDYLSATPERVRNLRALPGPREPTLFD